MENEDLEGLSREATLAYEVARDAARAATGEQWPGAISATTEAKLGRVKNYKRGLAAAEKELKELRAAVAENAQKARQSEVHKRSSDDATRRLHKLSRENARLQSELTSVRLVAQQVRAAD